MRLTGLILVLGILVCSQQAVAAVDFDPATLGHMKAVLRFCGGVNRQQASQYLLSMKALIGKATRQEVAKISKSEAYQQAYQSVRAELSDRSPQQLASSCSMYLAEAN